MNLLLFCAADRIQGGQLRITDSRLQHLLEVHRKDSGDTVRVGEIDGDMGNARIIEINQEVALLAPVLDQVPPEKLPLTLVVALPRPKMLRRILRAAAELGVSELHLINSYRVEKSYWQTPVLQAATIREYLLQGLEQSRDTRVPQVHLHKRFKPSLKMYYPPWPRTNKPCLHTRANTPPAPAALRAQHCW